MENKNYDLIVFSHLRWEFVTQRPQHIVSRLSTSHNILFIEEPIRYTKSDRGTARELKVSPRLTVVQPRISSENMIEELSNFIKKYIYGTKVKKPILWFYSAMFSPILDVISPRLVVYDCMDELASFKNAPKELVSRENFLLSKADIVFTGGKSLYESKNKVHDNVYCFPSSVDATHFKKSFKKSTSVPDDLLKIKKPIVGFYGVLDERLDTDLLREIATLAPYISFVLIGPLAKIEQTDLPNLVNIHYLGARTYQELPQYLKGFDIAMMPFALNEATTYISPTKTLEFMAALKPIISTPIKDVVRDYKKEIAIVQNSREFILAIKNLLNETPQQKDKRQRMQTSIINNNSWDKTTFQMKKIIRETLLMKKKQVSSHKNSSFSQFTLNPTYD